MNRNLKKTITAVILLAVTAINIFLAKNQPDKFFAAYIPFSRKAVNIAAKITSFVPFSIWEIISGFLIYLGIFWLVCGIRKKDLLRALSNIFLTVTALIFIFINIWGLNYFAPADPARFGLKNEQYTPEQLQEAAEYFLTQANALALQATDSYDEKRISAEEFNAAARQAKVCYEKLRQKNKNFDGEYIKPKMLTSSGYFAKEAQAPEGFYLDENAYYFAITTDGETVTVENEAGKGFVNAAQVGSLRIVKTSSDGKLEGFSFRVTGANGYDQVLQTDAEGVIFIEGLRIGDYTVSEVRDGSSDGYLLPADKMASVYEGAVTEVEMHNEKKPTPEVPQTGDSSHAALWLALLGLSGIGAVSVLLMRKRKK